MSRFANRKKIINKEKMYANIFKGRGVNQIEQYGTRFLRYPTQREVGNLDIVSHVWSYGDMYYKLAHDNYGDPTMWWVIAFFNQRPTESQLRFGSVVYISHPIERVLSYYGV